MPPYDYLVHRVYEMSQIIVSLAGLGIAMCVVAYALYEKYDELQMFLKDDGLQDRFARYKIKKQRIKWTKQGKCPSHGTPLHFYNGKCPIAGCKEEPQGRR